jgi:PIN domain nuclease of toxin-antitoxin system
VRVLLDTHLLLWLALDDPKCPERVREWASDAGNEVLFSAASIWEVAALNSRKERRFPFSAEELRTALVESGYVEVPVEGRHAALVEGLPRHHADPFDRMLVAQAMAEGCVLATHDHVLPLYGEMVVRV